MSVKFNEAQLLVAFEQLNVKELHRPALRDVLLNGYTSYAVERKYNLSTTTISQKVKRLEAHSDTCYAFVAAASSKNS